ncbi:MAG: 30S ribosomal protein S27ae [Candidatus Bathyarchaeia archaeon]|nr:30S ribosomal protein S27ae [Candidatus Bathyarchaeota archaeon]
MSKSEGRQKKKRLSLGFLYDYNHESGGIKLRNRKCPRCGNIMAHHKIPKQRWTCGSCRYTDYIKS